MTQTVTQSIDTALQTYRAQRADRLAAVRRLWEVRLALAMLAALAFWVCG